ncbi:MAG: Na/Pi symporter [Firmicutes bacterium]|nr:Na/Pi symporter [Bacillota bacterium]
MIALIPFIIGVALFLLSITAMSRALSSLVRVRASVALQQAAVLPAFISGLVVTAMVQSSSLVSVVLVGLAEAEMLSLGSAFAAVLGANVGTTLTAQIAGVRPGWLGWAAGCAGIVLVISGRRRGDRGHVGRAALGLAGLILGLGLMESACSGATDSKTLRLVLTLSSVNPLLSAVVGAAATAVIQSSSLFSSILVYLARSGLVPVEAAVSMVIGSNVGTCVTALIASFGTPGSGRALARANALFNFIGACAFLPFVRPFCALLELFSPDPGRLVANAHFLFNAITAAAFLPVAPSFAALVRGSRMPGVRVRRLRSLLCSSGSSKG